MACTATRPQRHVVASANAAFSLLNRTVLDRLTSVTLSRRDQCRSKGRNFAGAASHSARGCEASVLGKAAPQRVRDTSGSVDAKLRYLAHDEERNPSMSKHRDGSAQHFAQYVARSRRAELGARIVGQMGRQPLLSRRKRALRVAGPGCRQNDRGHGLVAADETHRARTCLSVRRILDATTDPILADARRATSVVESQQGTTGRAHLRGRRGRQMSGVEVLPKGHPR